MTITRTSWRLLTGGLFAALAISSVLFLADLMGGQALAAMWVVLMLFAVVFALGVVRLLVVARQLRQASTRSAQHQCMQCGYDLRGTLAASGTQCPECGTAISALQQDWFRYSR